MRVIGLMSGTSMDGIDCVLIETDGEHSIQRIETASLNYDKNFKFALKKAEQKINLDPKNINHPDLIEITQQSAQYHAEVISLLLSKLDNLKDRDRDRNKNIDLIGYHGQTLYHNPAEKITVQIADAPYLSHQFNIPVVYDFRSADIQHGGQGAPLAPLYHQALMVQKKLDNLVVINCGGIANISILSGGKYEDILGGFDTGPGNVLLDQFVRHWTNQEYLIDYNGEFALKGNVDDKFLDVLLQKTTRNNYYLKLPPKSLDSQDIIYIEDIAQRFPKDNNLQNLYDGCATLAAFTAYTLSKSIPENIKSCVISGGGAKNPAICQSLKSYLPQQTLLYTADEFGWSTTYMEAELIAWLAVRSVRKLPLSVPQTTGVKFPVTGGQCVYPELN